MWSLAWVPSRFLYAYNWPEQCFIILFLLCYWVSLSNTCVCVFTQKWVNVWRNGSARQRSWSHQRQVKWCRFGNVKGWSESRRDRSTVSAFSWVEWQVNGFVLLELRWHWNRRRWCVCCIYDSSRYGNRMRNFKVKSRYRSTILEWWIVCAKAVKDRRTIERWFVGFHIHAEAFHGAVTVRFVRIGRWGSGVAGWSCYVGFVFGRIVAEAGEEIVGNKVVVRLASGTGWHAARWAAFVLLLLLQKAMDFEPIRSTAIAWSGLWHSD